MFQQKENAQYEMLGCSARAKRSHYTA